MNLGPEVRNIRHQLGLTQAELAEQLNISPGLLSRYENSRRKIPLVTLIQLAAKAMTTIDELIRKGTPNDTP